jgi:hypothetical protein
LPITITLKCGSNKFFEKMLYFAALNH